MKSTFQVLNRMVADGVIERYAVGGDVAALNYIEPTLTDDLVLISVDDPARQSASGLVTLEPVFASFLGPAERDAIAHVPSSDPNTMAQGRLLAEKRRGSIG